MISAGNRNPTYDAAVATIHDHPSSPDRRVDGAEWTEGRRYLGLDVLTRARLSLVPDTNPNTEEATTTIPALSA
jgi:hypothetical protein